MPLKKAIFVLTFALICIFYLIGAIYFSNTGGLLTGWFVTDGMTLFDSANTDRHLPLNTLVENNLANLGLAVLNAGLVSVHHLTPAVINCIALCVVYISIDKNSTKWAYTLLAFTPLYLTSILLPSKDIIVLFIFL